MSEPYERLLTGQPIRHPHAPWAWADTEIPFVNPDLPAEFTVGFVVGHCGHRVARSEWRAGLRNCEHCG